MRPATMAGRLAPYIRYCSTQGPIDDHGPLPSDLVVFEDELEAVRLLAGGEAGVCPDGVDLPLLVSDRAIVNGLGPLGCA